MRATRVDAASKEEHMRWLLSLALLVVAPTTTWAQEPDRTEITSVEAPVTAEPSHSKVTDKKFWLLGAALNTSMLLDTKSTFDVTRRCLRCVETNPYAAPFVNRGPAVAFTAGEAFDLGVMAVAAKIRGSRSPMRRIWWLVPAALTTGHLVAYRHNLQIER